MLRPAQSTLSPAQLLPGLIFPSPLALLCGKSEELLKLAEPMLHELHEPLPQELLEVQLQGCEAVGQDLGEPPSPVELCLTAGGLTH